ncbi:hypothetical protein WOSG25_070340 [Weissella oryzae SG25]|uniref:Uncharacterized protein n=1 Tax=Weissella oryzae (strain DSM 25784 / JCM 18191 / LMG 30913 / SG25) TaxID=1329250 RepID=A0A069CUH9_WEIOS|nr:hypothetical protein [Weissella oryzae]GAK31057.1 hypothetical protein WOSG25_070340 [Weissella oryzae SG25]
MADYTTFSPGNNIWKKAARFLGLSFARIGILGGHFGFTYLVMNVAFSYEFSFLQLGFVISMICAGVYAIFPAPSNPHATVLSEISVRVAKAMFNPELRDSVKVMPLERED